MKKLFQRNALSIFVVGATVVLAIVATPIAQGAVTCDGTWRSIDPAAHGKEIVGV